jgi:hypothetical protein
MTQKATEHGKEMATFAADQAKTAVMNQVDAFINASPFGKQHFFIYGAHYFNFPAFFVCFRCGKGFINVRRRRQNSYYK